MGQEFSRYFELKTSVYGDEVNIKTKPRLGNTNGALLFFKIYSRFLGNILSEK
jgi:hypothetical protein